MLNEFLQTLHNDKTKKAYGKAISNFLSYYGKEYADITPSDVIDYKHYLEGKYADATVQIRLVAIGRYFKYLYSIYKIDMNPCVLRGGETITLHKAIKPTREKSYISFEDAQKLIDAGENTRDKAIVATYLSTGIRAQELINLTISDYEKRTPIIITKGNKPRRIKFNDTACKYIEAYLKDRKKVECDNIFISNKRNPMSQDALNKALKRMAKRAGLPLDITNHSLRHTTASKVLRESDPATTRDFFNWSSISMVDRYTHSTTQEVDDVCDTLNF